VQEPSERPSAERRVLLCVQDKFVPEVVHDDRGHPEPRPRVSRGKPEPLTRRGMHPAQVLRAEVGVPESEPMPDAAGKFEAVDEGRSASLSTIE